MQTSDRGGNSVYLEVRFWYEEKDGAIHMTAPNIGKFHVAVNGSPDSRRGHPSLFKVLAQCLRDNDATAPPDVTSNA